MFDAEPDGWKPTTLGAIATLGGGTTPPKSEEYFWTDGSIPWATPSDITSLTNGESRITATEMAVTERALKECSLTLNAPGTVLMTSRATIGYAALNDVPMTTNQGFITFRCGDNADPEFLLYWLASKRDFLIAAAGGSTFKELSRGTAKLLPISLPPLDEQRRIAEVLRSVDKAIATTEQVERRLLTISFEAVEALVVRGLAPSDTRSTEIGEVPVAWEVTLGRRSVRTDQAVRA
jgi:type I restriction enzyme S subunit